MIKESTDAHKSSAVLPSSASVRSASDYLALAIATCGVGLIPLAPGTWGSLVGVAAYIGWQVLTSHFYQPDDPYIVRGAWADPIWTTFTLLLLLCLSLVGVWAGTRVEKITKRKDAGLVVIDEVVGQLITLLFLPGFLALRWPLIVAGFLLFRIFDITKPYPIRRLEKLEGGLGVMADDILAGVYAALALNVVALFFN